MPIIDDPILLNDWHVLARSGDVPAGSTRAARLLGEDVVLWRGASGLHAWKDLCIHRGAKLSPGRVQNDCLICPYHGWTYDAKGMCTRIPAHPQQAPPTRARTYVYHVRERYDLIWVCLGEPRRDIPEFPQWDDPSYRVIPSGPYRFRTYGPRIVENFLDVGHLAHVHAGLLGESSRPEIDHYEVELSEDGVLARDIPIWQPNPDGSGKPGLTHYTYQVLRPLTATFVKKQGEQRFCMIDIVTPIDDNESQAWAIMAINYLHDLPEQQLRDFQDLVTSQDVPIVESQRPELLPLDLQAEMHLRSDRTAIAYRKWLRQIGLKHGTA
jgi:phenylpropionate dioxygenase-like ring-hydroxylating dioxygenase large terminal subunit